MACGCATVYRGRAPFETGKLLWNIKTGRERLWQMADAQLPTLAQGSISFDATNCLWVTGNLASRPLPKSILIYCVTRPQVKD